jgi:serine phosphatase RsbU (regulator of sigma subunit)/CHASE2 domain-containing sensor protein
VSRLPGLLLAVIRAGRGRAFPLLLLLIATGLLTQPDIQPLLGIREAQFDHYQRVLPRQRDSEPVIVVGIDSQSLLQLGQWPWPRDLIATLVDRIQAGSPLAVGIDIIFAERDRYSPEVLGKHIPAIPADTLAALPDPDRKLARSLEGPPTVLAIVGLSKPLPGGRQPAKPLPVFDQDAQRDGYLPHFVSALTSRPLIESAAAGEGLINASPELRQPDSQRGVLRRVPTLAFVSGLPFLSLPLEMVRVALGDAGSVQTEDGPLGMRAIRIGDYRLPVQRSGELLLHFGRSSSNYYLSAADVLAGLHDPGLFKSRFVIIGFNSTGLQDRIVTPLGESLPGVDIHAQVIESVLTGQALQRPYWVRWLEMGTLLGVGLALIAFIPKLRARYAVLSFVLASSLVLAGGYLAFFAGHYLFDGASILLLLGPSFISLLGNTLISSDALRRSAEAQLLKSREESARMNGELDAARRIQMGLLPDTDTLFPNEPRFSVAALLEPARAVGGDYYDCFMLDDRRLCIAIGDVSGKGVPASLFMAISKTLTGTLTRRHTELGMALRDIESELNRENPECLFVTAFIGILDAETGQLEYVCAGHDAPLIVRNGQLLRIDTQTISGPPLCAAGSYPFGSASMKLHAGDLLCLFTDGVTEATNGQGMFGGERLQAALREFNTKPAHDCAVSLRNAVRDFEAGHPPADDLTLLLVRWRGPTTAPN